MSETEKEITGSGRSIKEFNLIKTLQEMPEVFAKFGGHPQACGFTLRDKTVVDEFKSKITEKAKNATTEVDLTPQIIIDAEIDMDEVNWKLYDLLEKFEPFGQANENQHTLLEAQPLLALSRLDKTANTCA
jgi:single-stranded-DNA-specific exonuclease